MQNIIVGIDGGGSKCKILVKDEQNQELCMLEKPGITNIAIDTEQAWRNIASLYEEASTYIQTQYNININNKSEYLVHIGLGLAGVGIKKAREKFESLLNDSQLFASSQIESDAFIAYFGAFGGKDGIIIISGTGSIGLRYENRKVVTRYGGMGFPHGDEGSMADLGLRLAKLVLKRCNSLLKNTGVEVDIRQAFNILGSEYGHLILALLENTEYYKNNEDIIFKGFYKSINELEFYQCINSSDKSSRKYAQIGKFILDVLNNTETQILELKETYIQQKIYSAAKRIMKRMASKINEIYNEVKKEDIPVALYGGASHILVKYIASDYKDLFFSMPANAALNGACEMVLENIMPALLQQLTISTKKKTKFPKSPLSWVHTTLQRSNVRSPSIASSSSVTSSPSITSSSPSVNNSPFASNSPFARRNKFTLL